MTRETKIGLLIGLGFIVVFAVLLSHTGRVPPPGDGLDSVIAERARPGGERVDGRPGSTTVFPEFSGDDRVRSADSPSYGVVQDTSARDGAGAPGLPRPGALDLRPEGGSFPVGADDAVLTGTSGTQTHPGRIVEIVHPVAPPLIKLVDDPEPTPRHGRPAESPAPEPGPGPTAPAVELALLKEYLVQKGDNLGKISEKFYDTAAAPVVDFLAKSNEGRIKNKDLVLAGQKLVILELPPHLVESVSNFGPAKVNRAVRLVEGHELTRRGESNKPPGPRQAPKPALGLMAGESETEVAVARSGEVFRWHVVKPKETMVSIARKQLGSAGRWPEIQALNKQIRPTKMRPGDRIRLPKRRPLSEAASSGRASA